jgi:hypothetical protein
MEGQPERPYSRRPVDDGDHAPLTAMDLRALERCVDEQQVDGSWRVFECPDWLDGPEVEVRTSTDAGMHRVRSMTPLGGGADGKPPALSADHVALIRSTVMALLDLAGLQSGGARVRLVRTATGLRVRRCEMRADEI